ncbi:MAG: hypothetical protein CMJ48_09390 [Planctomycetaceae bacterium]|nr:hypothetical protein [Planctomycetaceae bacterium]
MPLRRVPGQTNQEEDVVRFVDRAKTGSSFQASVGVAPGGTCRVTHDNETKREEASMPLEVADAWAEVYIDVAGNIWDGDRERDVGERTSTRGG